MKKDFLLARLQILSNSVQESLENHNRLAVMLDNSAKAHNGLVGRLDEVNYLYQEAEKMEQKKEEEITKKPLK